MNIDNLKDSTYVVHAKYGYEHHRERIIRIFKEMNLPFQFMSDGDPSCFTEELLNKYFIGDILNYPPGIISCPFNHLLCYEDAALKKSEYSLVFEDDVFFISKNFKETINKILFEASLLPPGFIISLENTSLEFPPSRLIKKNKLLYPATHSRCAGAYIIDLKAVENILNFLGINKCTAPIDLWHNLLCTEKVIDIYWAHPPLTEQGSHNGLMSSTISTKKVSYKRRIKWLIEKNYKQHIRSLFK